ncbi:uncharacterized protein LOC143242596 [Tachypleus tridentatus]|uniref:uncharacterized protein LOC143242596 n=1 Tax=Tachypleus tridentatus TaxID=6853 RepID=UPI003FD4D8AA
MNSCKYLLTLVAKLSFVLFTMSENVQQAIVRSGLTSFKIVSSAIFPSLPVPHLSSSLSNVKSSQSSEDVSLFLQTYYSPLKVLILYLVYWIQNYYNLRKKLAIFLQTYYSPLKALTLYPVYWIQNYYNLRKKLAIFLQTYYSPLKALTLYPVYWIQNYYNLRKKLAIFLQTYYSPLKALTFYPVYWVQNYYNLRKKLAILYRYITVL